MGACVFVASGLSFDVDGYLRESPFKAVSVFRKDEIPAKETTARPDSGFVVVVGEGTVPGQVESALKFLAGHERDFQTLRQRGVDRLLLDFGVERTARLQESHHLPSELIARMGELGLGLIFSTVQVPQG